MQNPQIRGATMSIWTFLLVWCNQNLFYPEGISYLLKGHRVCVGICKSNILRVSNWECVRESYRQGYRFHTTGPTSSAETLRTVIFAWMKASCLEGTCLSCAQQPPKYPTHPTPSTLPSDRQPHFSLGQPCLYLGGNPVCLATVKMGSSWPNIPLLELE